MIRFVLSGVALIALAGAAVSALWTVEDIQERFRAPGSSLCPVTRDDIIILAVCACVAVTALHSLACLWITP